MKRLSKMPFKELPYRVHQLLKKRIDKLIYSRNKNRPELSSIEFSGKSLSEISGWEFYIRLEDEAGLLREADSFLKHVFDFFGIKYDFGDEINFHLDPKTGKSWAIKFWGDIDFRDGQTIGGIKFAWELNRLHHLPKLASAYIVTGDNKYLDEIFRQLDSWLKTNPYPQGINWIMGIELGIRLVNLYYVVSTLNDLDFTPERKEIISRFIALHGHHLARYPSKHTSRGNHALAEAIGLFCAGLMMPHISKASKWEAEGKRILEQESVRQIFPDGSSFEHSIPYLQFVIDHFLIFYLLSKRHGVTIDPNVEKRLSSACNFLVLLIDKFGNIPMIGDSDDGYLIKFWFGEHNNYLSILNTCAILFNRPEWIHPRADLDAKSVFLVGKQAVSKWEKLRKEDRWQKKSAYLPQAGLGIIYYSQDDTEIQFVGNSGPLGCEPLGGHGHADALSFWLSVNGQPFFIDPGTYLYHSGGKWRRYFRSTQAHNTIQVDGQDQSEQVADLMFESFYNISDVFWEDRAADIVWSAAHDGYHRLADPLVHKRKVTFFKNESAFEIVDELTCSGEHDIKICFHLHPAIEVEQSDNNSFLLKSRANSIQLQTDDLLSANVFKGLEDPVFGWYSLGFNKLEPTNSLVFNKKINGDSKFKTSLKIN